MNKPNKVPLILSIIALLLAGFAHHDANMRVDDLEVRVKTLSDEVQNLKERPAMHPPVRMLGAHHRTCHQSQ